jgi:hypothetical protein
MLLGDPSELENTQTETGYIEGLHWVRQTDFLAIATKVRFPPLPTKVARFNKDIVGLETDILVPAKVCHQAAWAPPPALPASDLTIR